MLLLSEQLLKLIVNARHSLYLRLTLTTYFVLQERERRVHTRKRGKTKKGGQVAAEKGIVNEAFYYLVRPAVRYPFCYNRPFPCLIKKTSIRPGG